MAGKYTKKAGQCKYSGWSRDGISQFNALRKVVEEDRACPEAEQMEKELMRFCRASAGKKNAGDNQDDELDAGGAAPNNTLRERKQWCLSRRTGTQMMTRRCIGCLLVRSDNNISNS
ncbi:hypothetical protein MHU86_24032 [Fragilaria crotonensis]|nr:hypothetical protein MHU86_24032 [Fragilaria crotonensis]